MNVEPRTPKLFFYSDSYRGSKFNICNLNCAGCARLCHPVPLERVKNSRLYSWLFPLNIKPKMHNITILHYIGFALDA